MIKKLQSQIKDLEKNLVLNKDILNRLLSSSADDNNLNTSLMSMIRELQTKNGTLEQQVVSLLSEKEFASQQAESFAEQIKQLQEQSMSDQERRLMKEQIIMVQQKLAEKETKYIKLDNELRTKKKEMEKLQRRLEDTLGGNGVGGSTMKDGEEIKTNLAAAANVRINNHHQLNSQNTIDFDELMNTSIDAIT